MQKLNIELPEELKKVLVLAEPEEPENVLVDAEYVDDYYGELDALNREIELCQVGADLLRDVRQIIKSKDGDKKASERIYEAVDLIREQTGQDYHAPALESYGTPEEAEAGLESLGLVIIAALIAWQWKRVKKVLSWIGSLGGKLVNLFRSDYGILQGIADKINADGFTPKTGDADLNKLNLSAFHSLDGHLIAPMDAMDELVKVMNSYSIFSKDLAARIQGDYTGSPKDTDTAAAQIDANCTKWKDYFQVKPMADKENFMSEFAKTPHGMQIVLTVHELTDNGKFYIGKANYMYGDKMDSQQPALLGQPALQSYVAKLLDLYKLIDGKIKLNTDTFVKISNDMGNLAKKWTDQLAKDTSEDEAKAVWLYSTNQSFQLIQLAFGLASYGRSVMKSDVAFIKEHM